MGKTQGNKSQGRQRGRPASSRGRGNRPRQSEIYPFAAPRPSCSTSTIPQFLLRFTRRGTAALSQEEREQVCTWVADRATSSLSQSTQSNRSSQESVPRNPHPDPPSDNPAPSHQIFDPTLGHSQELFSVPIEYCSLSLGSVEEVVEEEIDCTDAQKLELSLSVGDDGEVPAASLLGDDETQLPTSDVRSATVEDLGEEFEEEVEDDPVMDPDWESLRNPEVAGGSNSEGEASTSARGSGVPTAIRRPAPVTVERVRQSTVTRLSVRTSPVWDFFTEKENDKKHVSCNVCKTTISRGVNLNNLTTTSMLRHLKMKHPSIWSRHNRPLALPAAGDTTASCTVSGAARSTVPNPDNFHPSPRSMPSSAPSSSAALSKTSVQLSLPQTLERKRKWAKNSPQALILNSNISEMLAVEMLPFRLVDTDSFRKLMASAVPRYSVPSRQYFSRRGVPALHDHLCRKLTQALTNAITGTVHLTIDSWRSACGQGQYLSLTAHWVNVVEAGAESNPGAAHILPTPRIAGPRSVRVSSTSYSSPCTTSTSSSATTSSTSWKHCSSAVGKRQQAVLKLIDLTGKQHTGQELWTSVKEQCDSWFSPQNLRAGMVVCDNARNLAAAIEIGRLKHVPCLAHVLNLVVQRFLKTYPCLPELLVKVRRLCAHFRLSSKAASGLATLQKELHLPSHRLMCDVSTRWNSSLLMIARVCEQRRAIVEYQLRHSRTSSNKPPNFDSDEWALMSDVCEVLRVFEDSTKMVSGDETIISRTIPLLCVLQRTLLQIKEDALQEEAGQMHEESPNSETLNRLMTPSPSCNADDQGVEEEEEEHLLEEEEILLNATGGSTHTCSNTLLRHGWLEEGGVDEEMDSPPADADSDVLQEATQAHMADFMFRCVSLDPRVQRIMADVEYWMFTLLDPRYKEKVTFLIPEQERDTKMALYKGAIVRKLMVKFPSDNTGGRAGTSVGTARGQHRETSSRSQPGRGRMFQVWDSFENPSGCTNNPESGSLGRRETFKKMVHDYMADRTAVLSDSSVPFNYWVAKLDTWHELALYALEILACPAASVLSERVFSAAGSIITNRRSRLSTVNVDRLTVIKMNKGWIGMDFSSPPDECSGT